MIVDSSWCPPINWRTVEIYHIYNTLSIPKLCIYNATWSDVIAKWLLNVAKILLYAIPIHIADYAQSHCLPSADVWNILIAVLFTWVPEHYCILIKHLWAWLQEIMQTICWICFTHITKYMVVLLYIEHDKKVIKIMRNIITVKSVQITVILLHCMHIIK